MATPVQLFRPAALGTNHSPGAISQLARNSFAKSVELLPIRNASQYTVTLIRGNCSPEANGWQMTLYQPDYGWREEIGMARASTLRRLVCLVAHIDPFRASSRGQCKARSSETEWPFPTGQALRLTASWLAE